MLVTNKISMANNIISCLHCKNKSSCFEKLSDEELQFMNNHRVEIKFKKGEIICKQGSIASNIMYLKNGLAKLYFEKNKQKNLILRIISTGSMFALPSISNNILYYSAMSYEDSHVCMIDIDVFKNVMNNNAKFASEVVDIINENTIQGYERMYCLTQNHLSGRMANILLCLSENIYKNDAFELQLSRRDIAELTNMSVESVTRILRGFKDENLIELNGKHLKIMSRENLAKICEVG